MIYKFLSPIKVKIEDTDFNDFIELDNKNIIEFYDIILTKIREFNKEFYKNGLIENFDKSNKILELVEYAIPSIGVYKGKICGVMLLKTKEGEPQLNMHQKRLLKEFFIEEYSKGWGEQFKKVDIKTPSGTLFVQFWYENKFSIAEESELWASAYYSPYGVCKISEEYPSGTVIELRENLGDEVDEHGNVSMPAGLKGTVKFVDDIGDIYVEWDNGRTVPLIPYMDFFKIIDVPEEKNVLAIEL